MECGRTGKSMPPLHHGHHLLAWLFVVRDKTRSTKQLPYAFLFFWLQCFSNLSFSLFLSLPLFYIL